MNTLLDLLPVRGYFSDLVKVNDLVELEAEPSNRQDPNAIKITLGRKRLGYVPKTLIDRIKPILESGNYKMYITSIDWDDSDKNYSYLYVSAKIEY